MRFIKVVGILAMLAALAIAALLIALSVERRTETTLPAPTGPFAVSRVIED